ncbi:MAG: TonB-dependent receptor [Chitinophagaceae bacterium]|nr:TonB-dependent receptor [Chitinophagaceae bacterium]
MLRCMKWRGSPSKMLLFFLLQFFWMLPVLAQEPRLDVDVENQPLSVIFQSIRKSTNYLVNYSEREVNADTRVTVHLKQATVAEVLTAALKGTGYEFVRNANAWIIRRKVVPAEKKERPARALTIAVTDAKSGVALGGVSINVQGTGISTMTDADGRANLRFIDSPAVLVLTSVGYAILTIPVDAGATTLNIKMNRDAKALGSVVVEARRKINNEASLLNDRKNAAVVSDGISAQQMERTASITTTQALQRVSGVTITDDKYVAIRGLGDRSVIAELNGVRLSSSDPDRSAIPLDLIPANLLDNIVVYKTETPDKPADAAAGIVELKTKSIPSGKTLSITAQTGWNSNIGIGGKMNSFYNSDMGTFGQKIGSHDLKPEFLNLGKQYPGGLSQIQQMAAGSINDPSMQKEVSRINNIMHNGFDPVLTTRYKSAPLNTIFSITYGNSLQVFHRHQLGLIAGASYYSRATDVYGGTLNQYSIYQGILTGSQYIDKNSPRTIPHYVTPNNINLGKYVGYRENTGIQTLNYGFLGGLSYRFNANHEISMQYMGSQGGETQATNLYGQYQYTKGLSGPVYSSIYSLKQTYRTLNTFNLQGEHKLWNGVYAPRLSYNGASSKSTQNDPDYRFVNLADYRPAGGGYINVPNPVAGANGGVITSAVTDFYSLVSGYVNGYGPYGKIQVDPNGRRYRKLNETNYNYKADLTIPFPLLGNAQQFKTGFNYLHRDRTFSEYVLSLPGSNFSADRGLPLYKVYGNLDQLAGYNQVGIHAPDNTTGEGAQTVSGFLYNNQKSPNNYRGFYETNAFYGMLDLHPLKDLRLTGGVRFEKTNIQSSVDTSNVYISPSLKQGNVNLVYINPNSAYVTKYKPYYSANLTYTLHQQMNFRLAFSTTLARPEMRELTNVFDYDPFQQALVVGNPDLVNQETKNYDFRWEWFPHSGEVLAASAFYKQIDHQLEKVFIQNSDGINATFPEFPAIEYQNDPNRGTVLGIELEVVKNLGLLSKSLNHFFVGANLLIAKSDVVKNPQRLKASRIIDRQAPEKSPLFEQAPYSVNAWINYSNPRIGTDVTATFNEVGERLIRVNTDGTPDLYSQPAPVLDLVFSQRLTRRLLLKGYAKNIFNPAFKEVYANPGNGGKYYGREYISRSFKKGSEFMLGLTYNLF